MENQQKLVASMDRYEYSVPKVSIDGKSHGELLLVAIGIGATLAVIILIVLTSLIRHKKKPNESEKKSPSDLVEGNFTLAPSPSDSGISNSSSQKSNLMFRYFGKSLSSFDLEKSSTLEMTSKSCNSSCLAINVDELRSYQKNILAVSETISEDKTAVKQPKYIQTIAC